MRISGVGQLRLTVGDLEAARQRMMPRSAVHATHLPAATAYQHQASMCGWAGDLIGRPRWPIMGIDRLVASMAATTP